MNHPVGSLAAIDEGVQCPSSCPHDVRTCLVVLGIYQCLARADDERAHQTFGDVIARIVIGAGEILLQDMAHDVVDAGYHLILGHGEREAWVEDSKVGVTEVVEHLAVLRMTGDNRAAVHLRTRARHGEHAAHRNPATGHRLPVLEVILPRIAIEPCATGHSLAIVNGGATAHTKDEVHLFAASQMSAFEHLLDGRIRHYACQLDHLTARLLQFGHHEVIDAEALDAATSVAKHHLATVVLQFFTQFIQ